MLPLSTKTEKPFINKKIKFKKLLLAEMKTIHPYSLIGRASMERVAVLLKLTSRFTAILIKIPTGSFIELARESLIHMEDRPGQEKAGTPEKQGSGTACRRCNYSSESTETRGD